MQCLSKGSLPLQLRKIVISIPDFRLLALRGCWQCRSERYPCCTFTWSSFVWYWNWGLCLPGLI